MKEKVRFWIQNFNAFSPDMLRGISWSAAGLFFFGVFLKVTWELYEDSDLRLLDRKILVFVSKLRVATLNGSAVDLTALGSPTVIALFTFIGLVILWLKADRIGFLYLGSGSIGAGLWTFLLKHLFSRERPSEVPRLVEVTSSSYPSGHSLAATSFYLLLLFLTWRQFRALQARIVLSVCACGLIGLVCLSRLYLGVHYPSDVLSGVCLGAAWVLFLTAYFSRFEQSAKGRG